MHRALVVPDVLTHIISQVESKDTLAALARTSSVVSGCALDKLWHTIENVVLLARCMPPGLWDEVEGYASVRNSRDNAVEVVYSSRLVSCGIHLAALRRLIAFAVPFFESTRR
jgi:hypothetical protein